MQIVHVVWPGGAEDIGRRFLLTVCLTSLGGVGMYFEWSVSCAPLLGSTSPPQSYYSGFDSKQAEIDYTILMPSIEDIARPSLPSRPTSPSPLDSIVVHFPTPFPTFQIQPTEMPTGVSRHTFRPPANSNVLNFVHRPPRVVTPTGSC